MPLQPTVSQTDEPAVNALRWQRILVPVDFSRVSLQALEVAAPLARDFNAQLLLLNVIEPAPMDGGMESVVLAVPDAELALHAEEKLADLARQFVPSAVPVRMLVDRGRAYDVITRVAREEKIDLIVLTTHGLTGLDHLLLGSTAERVVRHAQCPVYVVRPRAEVAR